jgi:hypothetical protein
MKIFEQWSKQNGIHDLNEWTIITDRHLNPVYVNPSAQRSLSVDLLKQVIANIKKSQTSYQSTFNKNSEYFSYYELIIDKTLKNHFRVVIIKVNP